MHSLRSVLLLLTLFGFQCELIAQSVKDEDPKPCRLGLNLTEASREGVDRRLASANLQPLSRNGDEDVIKIDTDLVISEFDVRDRRGRRVTGLGPADFIVEENGVAQSIEVFSASGASSVVGRSIILIIDHSNSQSPYLATSISAAKTLVSMLEPNDRMAIVTDDVELLTNFTSDKAALSDHLSRLLDRAANGKFGASKQFTAIFQAVSELFDRAEKRPVVIFQTDGDEFAQIGRGSTRRPEQCVSELTKFKNLEQLIERSGTTVYSIVPGTRFDQLMDTRGFDETRAAVETDLRANPLVASFASTSKETRLSPGFVRAFVKARKRDAAVVGHIATLSGGTAQYLERPDQAQEIYENILDHMNQRYLIGYYPAVPLRDGTNRSIRVRLRQGLDHKIYGRHADGSLARQPQQ